MVDKQTIIRNLDLIDLPDEEYLGYWKYDNHIVIPFVDKNDHPYDLEFDVNHNYDFPTGVWIDIDNGVATVWII